MEKQLYNILLHKQHYFKINKNSVMNLKERNNLRFDNKISNLKNQLKMNKSNFFSDIKLNKIKI